MFGSINLNPQKSSKKRFYLGEGSNIYRILPPAHSLAEKGAIAQYWAVIWLTAPNGRKYPVPSILQKGKNGQVLKEDPLVNMIEKLNLQVQKALAVGDSAAIKAAKDQQSRAYIKKSYALNALNQKGEVGVLFIPYTAYQALMVKVKELYANGIDPIGIGADKGLFFDFKRLKDDRGRTTYSVEVATVVRKTPQGPVAEYLRAPIQESEANLIYQQTEDLAKLFNYLPESDMRLLTSMTQEAFDAVFGRGVVNEEVDGEEDSVDTTIQQFATTVNTGKTASSTSTSTVDVDQAVKMLF